MNSRQLANVLIKVLGLWMCMEGIPAFVSGFLRALMPVLQGVPATRSPSYSWTSAVRAVVYLALGALRILRSRWIADRLLKNDD
jgi:hypothetical protein